MRIVSDGYDKLIKLFVILLPLQLGLIATPVHCEIDVYNIAGMKCHSRHSSLIWSSVCPN
ncbi:hypothetical protein DAPPUDRAFT_305130 [Daphnia pulex]|uniref:Uncharacterized protein n=1 Tax=Daphnia pulex TaxID=6669 RepID=E9GP18_DAPPU|nr:hypothetical protein DAPPUDRAFT_305130 [Daphnia pulex]|eukprot:EFX78762.1 hypothetical protein DAPPUDRAFT_305130 [Daphnia pulex]